MQTRGTVSAVLLQPSGASRDALSATPMSMINGDAQLRLDKTVGSCVGPAAQHSSPEGWIQRMRPLASPTRQMLSVGGEVGVGWLWRLRLWLMWEMRLSRGTPSGRRADSQVPSESALSVWTSLPGRSWLQPCSMSAGLLRQ